MGRGRAEAQDARAALQGEEGRLRDRRRAHGRGHGRLDLRRPVRRAAGPAAPARLPRRDSPTSSRKQKLGAGKRRRKDAHRVVAWDDVGETEGTGIVHIAPGCGKEDFALGKEQGLPPVAPLDECGRLPRRLRRADRQVGRRPGDGRLDPRQPAAEGPAVRHREVPAQLPALLALQDRAALPPRRRVVHRHDVARRDHATSSSRSTWILPESVNGKPASSTGSRTWATG